MNLSYFRIKLSKEEAISRFCDWNGKSYKERIDTTLDQAVDVSLNSAEEWKGNCLYVYENKGWTIFEDLTGTYSSIPSSEWKAFARDTDFIFAGYNDAIIYGEFITIKNREVQKEFLEYEDLSEENVNEGDCLQEINSWIDVAEFVDNDEIIFSEIGTVYIF